MLLNHYQYVMDGQKRAAVEALPNLEYVPKREGTYVIDASAEILVGAKGFEPSTPWSQTRCATRLRHAPTKGAGMENARAREPFS